MSIFVALLNLAFIFLLANWMKRKYKPESPLLYWSSFCVKVVAGISLGLIYSYYYSASDTWIFIKDAKALSAIAHDHFVDYLKYLWADENIPGVLAIDRSLVLVKLISVFSLVSDNNYWICSIYFSFIAFSATWYLYNILTKYLFESSLAAALAILFFPSVVFWGSGLVKETIALAGIYFIAGSFLKFTQSNKISLWELVFLILSIFLLWGLKYYWAAIFLPSLFTTFIIFRIDKNLPLTQRKMIFMWSTIFIFICLLVTFTHPNFYLESFLGVVVDNYYQFAKISPSDSLIHFYDLKPTWASILINSPWALFSGLFRPFIWEANGITALIASLENLFLIMLFISFFIFRKIIKGKWRFPIVIYSFLLCIFLALSTPNFGTLSRYRVGFLPFLVFVLSYRNPFIDYSFLAIKGIIKSYRTK